MPPPPALPFGTASSGRPALPPAAELEVKVSAPVAPRGIVTLTSPPVLLRLMIAKPPGGTKTPGGSGWAVATVAAAGSADSTVTRVRASLVIILSFVVLFLSMS